MNGILFKEEIKKIFKEAREKFPHITDEKLDCNGAIYYMNGNDSTRFDWEVNHRLCEFYVYHENERGFIKVLVNRNGVVSVYIYEDGGMRPTCQYETELKCGPAWRLFRVMQQIADGKFLWDKPIDELNWDVEVAC